MRYFMRMMIISVVLIFFSALPTIGMAEEYKNEKDEAEEEKASVKLEETVVKSERLVEEQDKITIKSEGLPAQVDIITKEDIKKMPVLHWTDMLRQVSGVQISKYTGYTPPGIRMRGFKSWRSSQIGVFIDGVPINEPQGPMNGQADMAWLIPEMIERIEVIKGPVSALYGDFALAGVFNIITKKSESSPSIAAYGGTENTMRAVGVFSDPSMEFTPFLVWEGYTQDGYQDSSDKWRGNLFNKVTFPLWQGDLSVRLHYWKQFTKDPGLLPLEEVKAGKLSKRDALDDTGDNRMDTLNAVLNYTPAGGKEGLYGTMFYTHKGFDRCYPSTSPPTQYRNDFTTNNFGWKLMYDYRPFNDFSLVVGNDLRYDYINGVNRKTIRYQDVVSTYYDNDVEQFSTGFFAQGQYKPFSFFKLVGGLRYDLFNIDVDNKLNPDHSGTATPNVLSPKIGMVITPYKGINIFANRAEGFRSPGARELSPVNSPANFDLDVAKVTTYDVGCDAWLFNRIFFGFDYYDTSMEREVWFDSATNTYQNLGDSDRDGYDVEAKVYIFENFNLYGNFSHVRARIKNPVTPGNHYVPFLSPDAYTAGFQYTEQWGDYRFGLDAYYVRYSKVPVTPDGTVERTAFDRYMSKLTFGYLNWTTSLDVAFNPDKYSTEYMPWNSKTGFWFVPLPKWELLVGLKYQF